MACARWSSASVPKPKRRSRQRH